MIQTGVLETHSEFEGRVQSGINFSFDDDMSDGNGHGTHVAVRYLSFVLRARPDLVSRVCTVFIFSLTSCRRFLTFVYIPLY